MANLPRNGNGEILTYPNASIYKKNKDGSIKTCPTCGRPISDKNHRRIFGMCDGCYADEMVEQTNKIILFDLFFGPK